MRAAKVGAALIPTALDTLNVTLQNKYINDTLKRKKQVKLVEAPAPVQFAVAPKHGLTAAEKANAMNHITSSGSGQTASSDFNRNLIVKNLNAQNKQRAISELTAKDAELFRQSEDRNIETTNANRMMAGEAAEKLAKRNEDLQMFYAKADIDAIQRRGHLAADTMTTLNDTIDSNRAYEAANQAEMLKTSIASKREELNNLYTAMTSAGPGFESNYTKDIDRVRTELNELLNTKLPSIRRITADSFLNFKVGGRIKLVLRK